MLFGRNFHILGLFRMFEIGREIFKNHGLTPLLFGEIFRPQKLSGIWVYEVPEIRTKVCYSGETFIF